MGVFGCFLEFLVNLTGHQVDFIWDSGINSTSDGMWASGQPQMGADDQINLRWNSGIWSTSQACKWMGLGCV